MIKEIKKGDRFRCKKDVVMHTSNRVAYRNGFTYKSDFDGCITGDDGDIYHLWNGTEEDFKHTNEFFKLISTKTQTGLDMPASCTPTTHEFQNYSKEYLDNAQDLQAFCDAMKPDGQDLSAYIKTGRIDVEPKLIRRFKSGAVRGDNTGRVRPDWISPYAIEEISKVLIENANDFGACNYFLGIDEEACLESMARHIEELKEAILITKDMTKAKVIARSVGFNAVAMLHTMVLKEKGLYKEHFDATELVTVEEAKKSNRFVG